MIRPFCNQDTESLLTVWYEASILAHDFIRADFWAGERDTIRNEYLPKSETYVYLSDGDLVGFISLLDDHIGGLFVHPQAQGQGIGNALVLYAAELRGDLTVNAFVLNDRAVRFYERLGFVEQGRGTEPATGFEEITFLRRH